MGFLAGKKLVITGLLSNRSIAYGIARACRREGAELAFSYVGERFRERTADFAREFDSDLIFDCDVGDDAQIAALFDALGQSWPQFDGFVHSIGFAPREAIAAKDRDRLLAEYAPMFAISIPIERAFTLLCPRQKLSPACHARLSSSTS